MQIFRNTDTVHLIFDTVWLTAPSAMQHKMISNFLLLKLSETCHEF